MSRYNEKIPRLEHYSQQFAKRLFACHPEWKQYESRYAQGEPGLLDYFLEVKIPSANPQVIAPLLIRTHPREVFVRWMEGWHVHISPWSHQSAESHYEVVLKTIDLLVSDEYLFANIYKDGECAGGWGGGVGSVPAEDFQPKPGQKIVVRSSRGNHDREF